MKNKLTIQIVEENPIATEIVKVWYYNQMIKSLETNSLPEEYSQLIKEVQISDGLIAMLINESARVLFDVFDSEGIYIGVTPKMDHLPIVKFTYRINLDDESVEYDNRRLCEIDAVVNAFTKLT